MMLRIRYIVLIVSIIMMLIGCEGLEEGKAGVSRSITDSKGKGVFLEEKSILKSTSYDAAASDIVILSCWFENEWYHTRSSDSVEIHENLYQLVVKLDDKLSPDLADSLFIKLNEKPNSHLGIFRYYIYAKNKYEYEIPDTLKLDFYLEENSTEKKLKSFILN